GDHALDADADGPAHVGVVRAGKAGAVGFDVAERDAAGDVRQPAIPGVADAAAHRAEPVVLGLAAERAAGRAVLDVGPVDVAFDAHHPRTADGLPVVAGGHADHAATRAVADGEAVPVGVAERAAAVDAEIEAGPVIGRRIHAGRLVGHATRRKVRGRGRERSDERESAEGRSERTLHYANLQNSELAQSIQR